MVYGSAPPHGPHNNRRLIHSVQRLELWAAMGCTTLAGLYATPWSIEGFWVSSVQTNGSSSAFLPFPPPLCKITNRPLLIRGDLRLLNPRG